MLFTVQEAAEKLKVDPQTIYRWIREGKIRKVVNMGRSIRITQEELDRFIYN